MREDRPLRTVVEARVREGRGGLLGPDTARRTRWYDLTLDCGHVMERMPGYVPRDPEAARRLPRARKRSEIKPPPTRARCDLC